MPPATLPSPIPIDRSTSRGQPRQTRRVEQKGDKVEYPLFFAEEFTLRRYQRICWILAHCARSFTYWPIRQVSDRLRQLPNVFYDLSVVTDLRPHLTFFWKEDVRRIFYGSDATFFAYFHGQHVALGRAWQLLKTDAIDLRFPHTDARPIMSNYEQLLSMKQAAEIAELTREQVDLIFWAMRRVSSAMRGTRTEWFALEYLSHRSATQRIDIGNQRHTLGELHHAI